MTITSHSYLCETTNKTCLPYTSISNEYNLVKEFIVFHVMMITVLSEKNQRWRWIERWNVSGWIQIVMMKSEKEGEWNWKAWRIGLKWRLFPDGTDSLLWLTETCLFLPWYLNWFSLTSVVNSSTSSQISCLENYWSKSRWFEIHGLLQSE